LGFNSIKFINILQEVKRQFGVVLQKKSRGKGDCDHTRDHRMRVCQIGGCFIIKTQQIKVDAYLAKGYGLFCEALKIWADSLLNIHSKCGTFVARRFHWLYEITVLM